MINYYDKNRFISKRELARLADVSPRTFSRYLATRRHILDAMGISPKAQKLPPHAVKYICEDYCIDLPPDLQDQKALTPPPSRTSSSPPGKKDKSICRKNTTNSAENGKSLSLFIKNEI